MKKEIATVTGRPMIRNDICQALEIPGVSQHVESFDPHRVERHALSDLLAQHFPEFRSCKKTIESRPREHVGKVPGLKVAEPIRLPAKGQHGSWPHDDPPVHSA